jgi:hypothetical protein
MLDAVTNKAGMYYYTKTERPRFMSCAVPGFLKMLGLANTRGAVAPVTGVQDSARIGEQEDRYWGIDMFLE